MSNAEENQQNGSTMIIAEWRLPISQAVIRLAARKGRSGFDGPCLEMGREVEVALLNEELSSDGPDVAYHEDKIYFTRTVLPQAEEQIEAYFVGRSNLPEWGRLMKKWRRG